MTGIHKKLLAGATPLAVVVLPLAIAAGEGEPGLVHYPGEPHLAEVRQLTFGGRTQKPISRSTPASSSSRPRAANAAATPSIA
jgi:hypothetical protein